MANTTKTNVESAPNSVQQIYKAWEGFVEWYENPENHIRGDKPTQWSKNITIFRKHGQYPRPAQILKALEETGIANIALSIKFTY